MNETARRISVALLYVAVLVICSVIGRAAWRGCLGIEHLERRIEALEAGRR